MHGTDHVYRSSNCTYRSMKLLTTLIDQTTEVWLFSAYLLLTFALPPLPPLTRDLGSRTSIHGAISTMAGGGKRQSCKNNVHVCSLYYQRIDIRLQPP